MVKAVFPGTVQRTIKRGCCQRCLKKDSEKVMEHGFEGSETISEVAGESQFEVSPPKASGYVETRLGPEFM